MDYKKIFHDETAFSRKYLQKRMEMYGFKNMSRMELFLWDLELFLQIQKRLGEHIVLKGGAATQFYLPIEAQRTSVDIDMIFCGTDEQVQNTLNDITKELGEGSEFFLFKEHIPKNPKTNLPMHTYHVDVPSVLSYKERNAEEGAVDKQELKIEFIMESEDWEHTRKTGKEIFAVESEFEYQLLPVSHLFADKLTTIGCHTIGVQDDRMDEQVKQFYDVVMLTIYRLDELDIKEVRKKYLKRAEKEWHDRKGSAYDIQEIIADVRKQLYRYSMVDSGEDVELKKYINDFKALYLNSKVEFSPQFVACEASLVRLLYESMLEADDWSYVKKALSIERMLELSRYEGREKGAKVKEIREMLIQEFASYSTIPANILKGKNLRRILWAIVDNSTFSSSITGTVKTKEFGDVGDSLRELRVAINSTITPEKKGILGLFQKGKQKATYVIANYESAETNIRKIEKDLQRHQQVLTKDVYVFDQMYDMNLEFYKELTMYIIAGKKALEIARSTKLIELKEKAEATQDQLDIQMYRDYDDACKRFEKRIYDLETTRLVSIQMAPQIRLLQNADQQIVDKLRSDVINTIPLWRNQMVLALGIEHTTRALNAQSAVDEMTNEMFKRNAETLKQGAIDAALASERGIVDIETLRKVNADIITSINEVVKIHEEGAKRRAEATEELGKIEDELKQALLEAGSR